MGMVVEIDKRYAIGLEEPTFLLTPGTCNVWYHKVETDDHVPENMCRVLKDFLIIRMSFFIFFGCIAPIAHSYFLIEIYDLVRGRRVGGEERLVPVIPVRQFPWL